MNDVDRCQIHEEKEVIRGGAEAIILFDLADKIAEQNRAQQLPRILVAQGDGLLIKPRNSDFPKEASLWQAKQILAATQHLYGIVSVAIEEETGAVVCVNGTMGAGKTTLLAMCSELLRNACVDVGAVASRTEITRYAPNDRLTSCLGVQVHIKDGALITSAQGTFPETGRILSLLEDVDVLMIAELFTALTPPQVTEICKYAREHKKVIVLDCLRAFASGHIPDAVREATLQADNIVQVYGIDPFSTVFSSRHISIMLCADTAIPEGCFRVTSVPPVGDPLEAIVPGAGLGDGATQRPVISITTVSQDTHNRFTEYYQQPQETLEAYFRQTAEAEAFYQDLRRYQDKSVYIPLCALNASRDILAPELIQEFATHT